MSGVRRESVSHASRAVVCFVEQNALLCGEDVWLCMCGCIFVVFDHNTVSFIIIFSKQCWLYAFFNEKMLLYCE